MTVDLTVAFLISVLAGMGVGGGGLLVIYLSLAGGQEQLTAQGINLLFFIAASLSALAVNLRKRALRPGRLLLLSAAGALFAVLGSAAAAAVDAALLRRLFGGLLILSGAAMLVKK